VASILGILAFLVAFTFGMAGSRFDGRCQVVLDESNGMRDPPLFIAFAGFETRVLSIGPDLPWDLSGALAAAVSRTS
jgi:hypothetical protein